MNDEDEKKVLENAVKFVRSAPMGLQNFKKQKEFENALVRILPTVKLTGGGGTVTATYLRAPEEDEELHEDLGLFSGIDLFKVGKGDSAQAIVAPDARQFHRILRYYRAEHGKHRPVVLRLLMEEFACKSMKCHAMLTAFLLVFVAVLFSEDEADFKRLMAELWSVETVRDLLKADYTWSNPTKYLETATIDMPEYEGELPPRWRETILRGLGVFPPQAEQAEENEEVADVEMAMDLQGIEEVADVEVAADLEGNEELDDVEMAADMEDSGVEGADEAPVAADANLEDSGVDEAEDAAVAEDATMEEAAADARVKDQPPEDDFFDALDSDFDAKGFINGEYAASDRAGPSKRSSVKEDQEEEKKVPRARHDFSTRGVSGFVEPMQRSDATSSSIYAERRPRKRPPKKNDLMSSSEPSPKSPRMCFDGSAQMAAQSTSTTAQVKPEAGANVRRHKVLYGSLEGKRLTDVDGIDKRAAVRLKKKGFYVEALFGQFLIFKKDREDFEDWIAAEVPLSPQDAKRCYECIRDYAATHV